MKNMIFRIPGLGCTYGREWSDNHELGAFQLKFYCKDETHVSHPGMLSIYLPLEAGQFSFSNQDIKSKTILPTEFLLKPSSASLTISAQSHLLKLAILEISDDAIQEMLEHYHLDKESWGLLIQGLGPTPLPRSVWIVELLHRLTFERSIARQPDSMASKFCTLELIKEIYYRLDSLKAASNDYSGFASSTNLRRAISFIESNLYQDFSSAELAAGVGMSLSTIQRMFQKELDTTPMKYVWRRRLEDSYLLLQTGRFSVSEVAYHIGFKDASAFTKAFVKKFSFPPSKIPT